MNTNANTDRSKTAPGNNCKRWLTICVGLFLIFSSVQLLQAVLPIPPMQTSPWRIASTNLPVEFESAVAKMFEAGMADPRGCDYREAETVIGDFRRGSGRTIKIHAWILPAAASNAQTNYAIGWNGLIYPVASIGSTADWKQDAAKMIRAMQPPAIPKKIIFEVGAQVHVDEDYSVAIGCLTPPKAAIIFRIGTPELVEQCAQLFPPQDPFLALSTGYIWTTFNRGVTAHMRGDDPLAYDLVTSLEKTRVFCEAEANARGFELQPSLPGSGLHSARDSRREFYYPFLKTFPLFLTDQRRRHARQTPLRDPAAATNKADRIAALIDQLENVAARPVNEYWADVDLPGDPTVKALIAEGWDAIESLLQCYEHDARLTRIVPTSFFDWPPPLTPVEVRSAAYTAIEGIIKTPQFAPQFSRNNTTDEKEAIYKASATNIREYVKKYSGTTDDERLFAILKDDHGNWLEAATAIVQPASRPVMPLIEWRYPWGLPFSLEDKTQMHGGSLKAKSNPSVTELLVKRIDDTLGREKDDDDDANALNGACNLLFCLAKWDPPIAIKTAQKLSALSEATLSPGNYRSYCSHMDLAGQFAVISEFRAQMGDTNALHEYALWLRSIDPEHFFLQIGTMLHPLAKYPEVAGWDDIPKLVFNDAGSVWCNYLFKENIPDPKRMSSPSLNVETFFDTALINNSSFREFIIRLLREKSPVGKIVGETAHGYWLDQHLSVNRRYGYTVDAPKDGTEINGKTFRTCDLYAWLLSKRIDGAPSFELYWPEERRNEAISAIIKLLNRKDSQLQTHHFQPA